MKRSTAPTALVLAVALLLSMALSTPVMALPSEDWLSNVWRSLGTVWSPIAAGIGEPTPSAGAFPVRRVGTNSETAPNLDPNGLPPVNTGDAAPNMDPDGVGSSTGNGTETAPDMDPDG